MLFVLRFIVLGFCWPVQCKYPSTVTTVGAGSAPPRVMQWKGRRTLRKNRYFQLKS